MRMMIIGTFSFEYFIHEWKLKEYTYLYIAMWQKSRMNIWFIWKENCLEEDGKVLTVLYREMKIGLLLSAFEILKRYFKNEHLNNTGNFKENQFVPVFILAHQHRGSIGLLYPIFYSQWPSWMVFEWSHEEHMIYMLVQLSLTMKQRVLDYPWEKGRWWSWREWYLLSVNDLLQYSHSSGSSFSQQYDCDNWKERMPLFLLPALSKAKYGLHNVQRQLLIYVCCSDHSLQIKAKTKQNLDEKCHFWKVT